MDEPAFKRQRLADACSCANVYSAAQNRHVQCVNKFMQLTATHGEDLSTCSAAHYIKHELKQPGLPRDCTACASALLAAGAQFSIRHSAAQAAREDCAPCLTAILAYSESMTSETDWSFVLQAAICSLSLEALQILLDGCSSRLHT
jgi:hypothetical protein